jgi:CubicO group peptidase (beta-lactamase class C family)
VKSFSTAATLALVTALFFAFAPPTLAESSRALEELCAAKPEEVGMSSTLLAKVDARIAGLLEKKRLAGASVVITRNGKLVYDKSFGPCDLANKKYFLLEDESKPLIYAAIVE